MTNVNVEMLRGTMKDNPHFAQLVREEVAKLSGLKIAKATMTTTREILVGIPKGIEAEEQGGKVWIVKPGSGVDGPKILMSPTSALEAGLLVMLDAEAAGLPR